MASPSTRPKSKYARPPKRRKAATTKLSRLEQLPAELLQAVFFYSMNVSLPRSSLHLATKLSSEHVFLSFTRRLFSEASSFHTDPSSPVSEHQQYVANQLTGLLSCKFFTWEFFRRYARAAYDDYCAKLKSRSRLKFEDPIDIVSMYDEKQYMFLHNNLLPDYLDFATPFHVPEKLLHGPWTQDRINFLYFLTWYFVSIDWKSSTAGETAKQGLLEAIHEGKTIPAICLLYAKIGVKPTTEILRMAATEAPFNRIIIMWLIKRATSTAKKTHDSYEGVDFLDPPLWTWAEQQEREGNPNGAWLKESLRRADNCVSDADDWRYGAVEMNVYA